MATPLVAKHEMEGERRERQSIVVPSTTSDLSEMSIVKVMEGRLGMLKMTINVILGEFIPLRHIILTLTYVLTATITKFY